MISDYKAYIFDIDGTLYSLQRMHFLMGCRIIKELLQHPSQIRDFWVIFLFRRMREKLNYKNFSLSELYMVVADQLGFDSKQVEKIVQKWMFEVPCQIIGQCAFPKVIVFIRKERERGKVVCTYSDYPSEQKLRSLELVVNHEYVSERMPGAELKPNRKAMSYILETLKVGPREVLYIGDRDSKDRASAELVNMDYLPIKEFLKNG